jgi:hypothetical protein
MTLKDISVWNPGGKRGVFVAFNPERVEAVRVAPAAGRWYARVLYMSGAEDSIDFGCEEDAINFAQAVQGMVNGTDQSLPTEPTT